MGEVMSIEKNPPIFFKSVLYLWPMKAHTEGNLLAIDCNDHSNTEYALFGLNLFIEISFCAIQKGITINITIHHLKLFKLIFR